MFEWLEFEEKVGRFWHRWASAQSSSYPVYPDAAVSLASVSRPLAVFFRAAGGESGVVVSAIAARSSSHRLNFWQRLGTDEEVLDLARLDEENLLLPPRIALFDDAAHNRDLYFWLAAMLGAMEPTRSYQDSLRQDISHLQQALTASDKALRNFPGLQTRHDVLRCAMLSIRPVRELPPVEAALEAVIRAILGDTTPLSDEAMTLRNAVLDASISLRKFRAPPGYRRFLPVPLWANLRYLGTQGSGQDADDEPDIPPATKAQASNKRKANRRHQDQAERDDPLVFNRFEKILSMAEMVNVNRMVDDDEDENAQSNAEQIEEITLSPNQQRAASKLKLDLDLSPGGASGEPLRGTHVYPEWNYRKRAYQSDHCKVLTDWHTEEADSCSIDAQTRRRIRRVRQQFEALRPRREWLRGQVDGNELDMDAVIRSHCDLAAVGESSAGVYMHSREQARDLAVSILIDVSLSTDAWVEDRRVVDIEKEALLVLAHGLASCGDDYSIHSFTSRRRQRIWVNTVKSFEEKMSETTERRIASLKPGYYTRMGAAIRHTSSELAKRPNRHRLLLVLSDGKPNDSDYYEGRYAVEDTRRAILEARQQEIKVFGVTIDRDAQTYIAHLFGPGGYAMVHKPEHLAMALPAIYRQIIAR